MLDDLLIYVGLMFGILLAYMTWKLRHISWKEYFSTKEGKGILKGIILAPTVIVLIAVAIWFLTPRAHAGTWVNDAGVYAGIDYTNKLSPMCERNSVDDRGTSNLGAWLNVWKSESGNVVVNSKYTHHSCVLGSDNKGYDAMGVELRWTIWSR